MLHGEELLYLGRSDYIGRELRYSPFVEECYINILGYIYNCIISQLDNICLSVYLSVRTRLSREVLHLMNYAFDE